MPLVRARTQASLGAPGESVTGIEELAQSLSMCIRTPLGSVPGRPEYGSRVHELIDADVADIRAHGPRYVRDAIIACLPRVEFVDCAVNELHELEVTWRPRGAATAQTTRVAR